MVDPVYSPKRSRTSRLAHASKTTGMHQRERRRFTLGETCAQCGKTPLAKTDRVAAHIMRYRPWSCYLCGYMELVTTCKKCNNASLPQGRVFRPVRPYTHERIDPRIHFTPVCVPYVVKDLKSQTPPFVEVVPVRERPPLHEVPMI
jgi:hypothetical protein